MPSLQNLLFQSTSGGSPFSVAPQSKTGGANSSQHSSNDGSTGSSQPRFDDALQAAQKPSATKQESDSTARNAAHDQQKAEGQQRSETHRQDRATQKAAAKASRKSQNIKTDTPENSATPNEKPEHQTDPATAETSKTSEKNSDSSALQAGDETDNATPSSPTDTSIAASANANAIAIAIAPDASAKPKPVTTEDTPDDSDQLAATQKENVSPEAPKLAQVDKHPTEKPLPPQLINPTKPTTDDFNPADSELPDDQSAKEKPATPTFQPLAKQALKVGQNEPQHEESQTDKPQQTQSAPQNAASQSVQTLLAETSQDASHPVMKTPDEAKPPSPAAPPTALSAPAPISSQLSTESADAAAPAQQMPQDQQDQTFEQVVMGLRGKLDPRNGKAEIRLDPPNLGTLHVSLSLTNGSLTAEFQSSSDVVRDLLRSNMEKLKSVLEGQGVTVDKLAVEPPADQVSPTAAKAASALPTGSPNHDGRSAGQYSRDPQPGQRRSPGTFGRLWQDMAKSTGKDAPIDVVA